MYFHHCWQLHEVPAGPLAPMEAVREVHSYADELASVAGEAREGHPTAVADIGDPGELFACHNWKRGASRNHPTCCSMVPVCAAGDWAGACLVLTSPRPLTLAPLLSGSRPAPFPADGVTYVTPTSFEDALRAAGSACALVDAVVAASRGAEASGACASGGAASVSGGAEGKQAGASSPTTVLGGLSSAAAAEQQAGQGAGTGQQRQGAGGATAAFSLCRPPGHHATADTPLGYCLFNNVALAARHAQRVHGLGKASRLAVGWEGRGCVWVTALCSCAGKVFRICSAAPLERDLSPSVQLHALVQPLLKRQVMILDFDLHHGNGTADIFANDPSVSGAGCPSVSCQLSGCSCHLPRFHTHLPTVSGRCPAPAFPLACSYPSVA